MDKNYTSVHFAFICHFTHFAYKTDLAQATYRHAHTVSQSEQLLDGSGNHTSLLVKMDRSFLQVDKWHEMHSN